MVYWLSMKRGIISFIFPVLILFFLFFTFSPTIYELSRQKDLSSSRNFELVHNYYTDYNFYLSRIREGWEGRWTVVERYTSEPHAGTFLQIFYLFLGRISRFIPDTYFAVVASYHIARLVMSGVLLMMIAAFTRFIFAKKPFFWQVAAFLIVVTASTWPIFVTMSNASLRFGGYMPWWTIIDSLQRTSFLPHILAGQILILFLFWAGANEAVLAKKGNWMVLGLCALALGTVFPPGYILVGAGYGFLSIYRSISYRHWDKQTAGRVVILVLGLPSLIGLQLLLRDYPWKRLVEFDALHPTVFPLLDYVKALGPTLPMGLIGCIIAIFRREKIMEGVIAWIFAWLGLLIGFSLFPMQSALRWTEVAVHIPLGIASAYAFYVLFERFYLQKKRKQLGSVFILSIPITVILSGFGTMYSSGLWQKDFIDQKIRAGYPVISMNNYIVYPVKSFMDAIQYMNYAIPQSSVVLSLLTSGNYIPAYAGKRVYVGHDSTIFKEQKTEEALAFFRMSMKTGDARAFLFTKNITHVFFGPEEQQAAGGRDLLSVYPFLQLMYNNGEVSIFSVNK